MLLIATERGSEKELKMLLTSHVPTPINLEDHGPTPQPRTRFTHSLDIPNRSSMFLRLSLDLLHILHYYCRFLALETCGWQNKFFQRRECGGIK